MDLDKIPKIKFEEVFAWANELPNRFGNLVTDEGLTMLNDAWEIYQVCAKEGIGTPQELKKRLKKK
jgi:hypothetical protein